MSSEAFKKRALAAAFAALVFGSTGAAAPPASATSGELMLRHGVFDPLGHEAPPAVEARFEAGADTNLHIVQFHASPRQEDRDAITERGGDVYSYLPRHSYVVKMDAEAVRAVAALPSVRWVGPYHPAYRLEEELLRNADRASELYPWQTYNILLFEPGLEPKLAVARRIEVMGGVVEPLVADGSLMSATLTPDQLFAVVRFDEVMFVDRWGPLEADMDIVRIISGANYIETVAGYTGQGVRGEVFDTELDQDHVEWLLSPIIHCPGQGSIHGTSGYGIVFAQGVDPQARGLCPDGQGIFCYYGGIMGNAAVRYARTAELLDDPYYAVFQTSAVGSPRTEHYTTISAAMDQLLFDLDIVVCQANGNGVGAEGRPEAWAKNIVPVGGVYHYDTLTLDDDCWCGGASTGPAEDGRISPDLIFFYDEIHTTTAGGGYTSFGGTSASTPAVAGCFGLFFQMWSDGIFGNPVTPGATVFENRCHMTTARAMMINTARQYPFSGLTHDLTRVHQGWGLPDLANMYDLREKMFIIDETDLVEHLQSITYTVDVASGEPALKATLIYADPPGNPASTLHRINDLTLKVTSPSGVVYWGNNGLLEGNWSTPGGEPNFRDTVENVFVEDPQAGAWTVEVIAHEINEDGHVQTPELDSDYALVVSGVEPGPAFGLAVTPSAQNICAPAEAVYDIDVEQFSGYTQPVTLTAAGAPPGTSVNFTVNPVTPPGTTTMIVSDTASGTPGLYEIEITGTAPDMQRTSVVDLGLSTTAPGEVVLTSPANGAVEVSRTPTLAWQPASQALEYDLELADNPAFSDAYTASTPDTSHDVSVELEELTTYYWHVQATNGCGDGAWSDTFTFTTLDQPDYFTEFFDGGGFDLHDWTVELIPDGSGDFYRICGHDATGLPTDPTGGIVLPLSDDDFIAVAPGAPVSLYGNSYAVFFIGSNGYITFDSGDTSYSESLADHFNRIRISGLFDDLNPDDGGTISWKQAGDRVAVTWENVPEYNGTGPNTFQIEMFLSGEIHITWTDIAAADGIVGLSNGGGVPPDYIETDFSAVGPCTPPCPADVNGDGVVDVLDLLAVLAAWGAAGGPEDINGDGVVNVLDLLEVLGGWGPC